MGRCTQSSRLITKKLTGCVQAQDEGPSFGNRAFPSGGGEHQGKLQIINEPATRADLRSLNANRHGTVGEDVLIKPITLKKFLGYLCYNGLHCLCVWAASLGGARAPLRTL